ncbi:MAG: RNA-binding transcriptional accessory protein [Clostridia bacterium]|nr:RNA-binding transcriptional accessory protein [Clostridia bacterium]
MKDLITRLAQELGREADHVQNVVRLLDEGNTIPFIARYRKEQHGTMDDQLLRQLAERLQYLRNLESRKTEILESIEAQGKLTGELRESITAADTLARLEDLYRPYRPKRRTRASQARERGLEPLAALLFAQDNKNGRPLDHAAAYVDPEKGVETAEAALQGALDIIAEDISDNAAIRGSLRRLLERQGVLTARAAKEEDSVYRQYYNFEIALRRAQGHQILAVNRGEREGFLKVGVHLERQPALDLLLGAVLRGAGPMTEAVRTAAEDAYDRLLFPSLEREMRTALTERACDGAIRTFALNLRPLLMQPPVKGRVTMGLDPGYRTGCKVAVVDDTGKVLETGVIYPTQPHNRVREAKAVLTRMVKAHGVRCIAIGNGTASRETEQMVAELIKEPDCREVGYMVVSEAGASVYSASPLAAAEFPDFDVSLRSAVSIARRLQDPLAELVKIDPKAIGVGQYQHDMPQARLSETLNGVVESCVNAVGVDLNTASAPLLARVAGLSESVAKNIVRYREENGAFTARSQLLKVSRLGPKAYEQCAGFLRVPESKNVLDNTGVHPESYEAARRLLTLCGHTIGEAAEGKLAHLDEAVAAVGEQRAAEHCGIGLPTLRDLVRELQKPGRDLRDELPPPLLRTDVLELKDLKPGMELRGTVRNVADFGAFVDIGVHQDGLVHISKLCDKFVRHPSEVVTVGDVVTVWVLEVDSARHRISLTMKKPG